MNADMRETPLARKIKARIRSDGPISVAAYMEACLHDPDLGYYRTQSVIGRTGDFITAPEISQVFGELIGLWCAVAWSAMGSPSRLDLIELGPGRGTLMRDALRAVRIVPGFRAALRLHLAETNPALRSLQREALTDEDVPIAWHDDLAAAASLEAGSSPTPAIILANEFIDAMPIEQAVFRPRDWLLRAVCLTHEGALDFCEITRRTDLRLPPELQSTAHDGYIFEHRPGLAHLAAVIAARAREVPLAALFVDYGHTRSAFGDTLQAVERQSPVSPFHAPGRTDLSAHVDFEAFASEARRAGLSVDGPTTQSEFLGALGIVERASRLMASNPQRAAAMEADVARLIAPGGMGTTFKAIGLRSAQLPPLPGFSPVDTAVASS